MRRSGALTVALLAGCVGAPPAPPAAGSDGDGTAGSGVGSSDGVVDEGSTSDSTSTGTPGGSTSDPAGTPLLVISESPEADLGDVELEGSAAAVLLVSNLGDGPATGMSGGPLALPFGWSGGAYPGQAGDCGDELPPGGECEIEVELAPQDFGEVWAELRIVHDDGEVSVDLRGRGVGQSANLLINPGAEDQGSPPPGWENVGAGSWVAGTLPTGPAPAEGRSMFYCGEGPNAQFVLQQLVAIDSWASLVDAGTLRIHAAGQTRNAGSYDQHRIRVRYLDELGMQLEQFSSTWAVGYGWQPVEDLRLAPVGTRSLQVELVCNNTGGDACGAYFDALELRGQYP